jgi:hypothetical protein
MLFIQRFMIENTHKPDVIWNGAGNGGIFASHLDGSWKHVELGRIRGIDFRLPIEVKFDWYSLDKPCLVSTILWRNLEIVRFLNDRI